MTGLGKRLACCLAAAGALALLGPAAGGAATPTPSGAQVTAFPQPDVPPTGGAGPLIVGPDGNVWFTGYYSETHSPGGETSYFSQIMRIDPQGQPLAPVARTRADGFAIGPDGNVWITASRWVSRITASGEVTTFAMPDEQFGQNFTQAAGPIVTGADGNLWLSGYRAIPSASGGSALATIDRMTPSGVVTQFDLPGPGSFPTRLALGPEGNVWLTETSVDRVGRITPTGQIQMFQLPRGTRPVEIVLGADGNLWVTQEGNDPGALGRITPSGEYAEFPIGEGVYAGPLVAGPDGRLWFAAGPGTIARMTPSGRISTVQLPQATSVADIVAGPEGNVWYTALPEPPCAPRDSSCGDGGNYESGIVGRIAPAALALEIEGANSAAKGRRAKVRISCRDGIGTAVCRGRVRLRAGGSVIAQRRFRLGTDLSRGIVMRLDREAREKLARRGHLRVLCSAKLAGVGTVTRVVKLKLGRR